MSNFTQTMLLRHAGGITAQWVDYESNQSAMAMFVEFERNRFLLNIVSGPEDWKIKNTNFKKDGYDQICCEAVDILSCLNSTEFASKTQKSLDIIRSVWNAPIHGIEIDN